MKQTGYIYKASGFWYVRYRESINGERVQTSKRICPVEPHQVKLKKAPPDVREAAERLLAPLNQVETTGTANLSLDQFLEGVYWPWLKQEREPSTAYSYKRSYDKLLKSELGEMKLWTIRTSTVSQALANVFRLNPQLSKASLTMYKAILYSMFKIAISQGYAPAPNPAGSDCLIPNSKNGGRPTPHYDLATILKMLGVLSGQAKVAVAIAGLAGLSQSELMGLQIWDYNGKQINVRRKVWKGKVGKTKTEAREAPVPVIETLREIIDEYLVSQGTVRPDRWLLVSEADTPKALDILYRYQIKRQIAVENIPWLGWHAFRRGIATNLKTLGVDDKIIQGVLRHSKLETTQDIYEKNNTVSAELVAGLDKLQNAIKGRVQ